MSDNVFKKETKQLIITPVGKGDTVELGAFNWNKRLRNELNDYAKPSSTEGEVERRIQNMNMVEEVHTFSALISDEFITKSSEFDNISTKEEAESQLDQYFKMKRLLQVTYGHVDVNGFLTEISVEESQRQSGGVFRIDLDFLVGVPMTGQT